MSRLAGKTAVILGASREGNMGQAIARRFLDEGARVVVSGRGAEGLTKFAREHDCRWRACDVRDKAQIQALVDYGRAEHGAIHVAVNAAATGQYSQFEQTTEAELDEMLSIIFKGSFYFMQVMVGAMTQGGSIINVSSAVADIMFENHAAYMGAKAGMNHVTRAVANEYGAKGIRANIISPGLTMTPMLGNFVAPGMIDAFIKEYPLGRITTVDDVANAAVFVASDECFMTGQTFHVTGGLTLRRNPTAAEIQASIAAAAGSR
jgi:NAD(P)-dependent dehydrogenase (short-subunit alcohol dehydrogenase family)